MIKDAFKAFLRRIFFIQNISIQNIKALKSPLPYAQRPSSSTILQSTGFTAIKSANFESERDPAEFLAGQNEWEIICIKQFEHRIIYT
jgi:hypothetical protein